MAQNEIGSGKIWLITGANRGLGAAIARAALDAGDSVVAGARNPDTIAGALGAASPTFLPVALDVTDAPAAEAAVVAALERFGRIDVLVNNAGYGQFGAFEETGMEAMRRQFETNVFGLMNVTHTVLPAMRRQRSGHIFNISSIGGFRGGDRYSAYAASKFAVEGFSESLSAELAVFGIRVTVVEPGFFRTDFLQDTSVQYGSVEIEDYAEASAASRTFYDERSGKQAGDPAKLGEALVKLAADPHPPVRFPVGTDAVAVVEGKIAAVQAEVDRWRELSASTDFPGE